ncbi:MAG: hypothetical protein IKD37_01595 [Clostridia bacterium]|nr:hypothetical protein [Clostridia bacterium]
MYKRLLPLLLVIALLCVGCSSAADQSGELGKAPGGVQDSEKEDIAPDLALAQRAMEAIGDDLYARGKAAGFDLIMRFYHQKYNPPEGWTPDEEQAKHTDDRIFYSFELYTPDRDAIDYTLLGELSDAILGSGLFYLTAEQIADSRWLYTSAEVGNERVNFHDVGVEIYMLNAPFGSSKIVQFSYARNDLLTPMHYCDWSESHDWDDLAG